MFQYSAGEQFPAGPQRMISAMRTRVLLLQNKAAQAIPSRQQ